MEESGIATQGDIIPSQDLVYRLLVMVPLLCICGTMKRFCRRCRQPEQNLRRNHQIPPEAPTTAPLDIWVSSLDPPPPYDEVSLSVPILNLFHSWLSNLL